MSDSESFIDIRLHVEEAVALDQLLFEMWITPKLHGAIRSAAHKVDAAVKAYAYVRPVVGDPVELYKCDRCGTIMFRDGRIINSHSAGLEQ